MNKIKIGKLEISQLIIGGNPFSGFSHQTIEKDLEMKKYYTVARIKETLKNAESLGVNTHISRADNYVMRYLLEYWGEGGTIQWIAQTCPELGDIEGGIKNAIGNGAKGCFIHGGTMEYLFAQNKIDCINGIIKVIKDSGLIAGVAGHDPKVFKWAEENINVDFYMMSHYNPESRDKIPSHVSGVIEVFSNEDRQLMMDTISKITKPVIHYKVMAGGRNDPIDTYKNLSKVMKGNHAVCIGIYTKENANMIAENVKLLEENIKIR